MLPSLSVLYHNIRIVGRREHPPFVIDEDDFIDLALVDCGD